MGGKKDPKRPLTKFEIDFLQRCHDDHDRHEPKRLYARDDRDKVTEGAIHKRFYRIYDKLGVHTYDAAIKKAKKRGLIH